MFLGAAFQKTHGTQVSHAIKIVVFVLRAIAMSRASHDTVCSNRSNLRKVLFSFLDGETLADFRMLA